jgi:hypothetical protein
MGAQDSNFNFEIIETLRSDIIDEKNRIDLMVVAWERAGEPVLEKRRVYILKNGQFRLRKLVGMTARDIQYISEHADHIKEILNSEEGV